MGLYFLEDHHMINKISAILLDKNHLRDEIPRLLSEALFPDDSDRLRAPESSDKLAFRKETLSVLVILTNPFQAVLWIERFSGDQ